jgi:pimeloyl-ACP methyl ester carboxylesterase
MFDLRNHGQSASGGPVTFGLQESNDLLGALDYLATRSDVDQHRIGVVGFSVGANALLFSLPHTDRIAAGVAVQPTSPAVFAERYARDLLGPLGKPVLALSSLVYQQAGHIPLTAIEPVMAAGGTGQTPILYIQGTGDRWGSVSNVAQMATRSPGASDPLFVETHHRYGGYRYPVHHPKVVTSFLAEHF